MKPRAVTAGILIPILFAAAGHCSSTTPNRNPEGEDFPIVIGTPLAGEQSTVRIPTDLQTDGKPILLLVGYVMETQFDLDRWLIGLVQTGAPIRFYEVPTVQGMIPGLFAGRIDAGMRSGIPDEDESSVITVYTEDADRIVSFTGNENPRNARVLLLDGDGRVIWFHDSGFSASVLSALLETIHAL